MPPSGKFAKEVEILQKMTECLKPPFVSLISIWEYVQNDSGSDSLSLQLSVPSAMKKSFYKSRLWKDLLDDEFIVESKDMQNKNCALGQRCIFTINDPEQYFCDTFDKELARRVLKMRMMLNELQHSNLYWIKDHKISILVFSTSLAFGLSLGVKAILAALKGADELSGAALHTALYEASVYAGMVCVVVLACIYVVCNKLRNSELEQVNQDITFDEDVVANGDPGDSGAFQVGLGVPR